MRASKACGRTDADGPCPSLQPCPVHARKPWAGSTRRERTISGSRQQRRAAAVMQVHDGICHVCCRPGSDEVDHVIPTFERPDLEDDLDNLRPIHSTPCHAAKTQAEARRARSTPGG